ncbi:MAG: patatin-like phospholipase family protein [Rhabdochlamydiaceae bacterium]|nr:patatin-like phospholipase family protein [Rhabdochlamydiaceae bacterium]
MTEAKDPIFAFLQTIQLFSHVPEDILLNLANGFERVLIPGGEVLIKEKEIGDCLYIVMHGLFKVYQKHYWIADVGAGEIIGEIAILTKEKRMATVQAARDSEVLKLTQESFHDFLVKYPEAMLGCIRKAVHRLVSPPLPKEKRKTLKTIAILAAGNNPHFTKFSSQFIREFSLRSKILHVNSSNCSVNAISWLSEKEKEYEYLIYETDSTLTEWSRFCFRQADRIVLVALAEESPELNELEQFLWDTKELQAITKNLVLLHPPYSIEPKNVIDWTFLRHNIYHHNVRLSSEEDFNKLLRFLSGQAVGLVLSGGGARGLAHVGVLRAFEEAKISIDCIAGSSMGAIIAASYSIGMNAHTILEQVENLLVPAAETLDYTLPFLSVKSGKNVTLALQRAFGKERHIEQSWTNFFCVSTNLSTSSCKIHKKGLLWEAIRASISIPAIFPPVITAQKEVLVDGGVMNNMPVDIMRQQIHEGKILASSIMAPEEHTHFDPLPPWVSGWDMFTKHLNWDNREKIPHIGDIILPAIMLSSNEHQKQMETLADHCIRIDLPKYGLMEFGSYEAIIEAGYIAAQKHLEKNPNF